MKKRTLRSKVKKAIDEIPCECDKLEKAEAKIRDLEERYKAMENQKYLGMIQNKEFAKRNFYHAKPDLKQYFPNLKELKTKPTSTPNLHLKPKENLVKEICKRLNKNEMLEVF